MRQRVKPWTRWHGGILVPSMSGVGTVTLPVPDAPVIAADTLSSSSIEITLVSGEGDVFQIERSLTGSGSWTELTADANFPYPATGLSDDTTYYFRCRGKYNGGNWSSWSSNASAKTHSVEEFSVNDGILTYNAGGGSGEVLICWDRPTTYTNNSFYRSPNTSRLYFGSATGVYDILNGVLLSDTDQPGATHVRVVGLTTDNKYYARVKAVNTAGIESAASMEAEVTSKAPKQLPESWDGDISSSTTLSSSGNYRITSDFTGTITISAPNVLLYGQDKTLTHSSDGVVMGSGLSNVEIRNIKFYPTNSGKMVRVNGTLGAGCSVHHCYMPVRTSGTWGVGAGTYTDRNLGGMHIYSNTISILVANGSYLQAAVASATNFKFYGNTIITNAVSGERNAVIGECADCEDWGNHWTLTSGTQAAYSAGYERGGRYSHDNEFVVDGGSTIRVYLMDGSDDDVVLHINARMSLSPSGNFRLIRQRASDSRHSSRTVIGYVEADLRSTSGNILIEHGDSASGGGQYKPTDTTWYYVNASNLASGQKPVTFYGGSGFGELVSWDCAFGGQSGSSSGGVWRMNRMSLPNGISNTLASWEIYSSSIGGGTGNAQVVGSWAGHNPASFTPSAPTNMRSV